MTAKAKRKEPEVKPEPVKPVSNSVYQVVWNKAKKAGHEAGKARALEPVAPMGREFIGFGEGAKSFVDWLVASGIAKREKTAVVAEVEGFDHNLDQLEASADAMMVSLAHTFPNLRMIRKHILD